MTKFNFKTLSIMGLVAVAASILPELAFAQATEVGGDLFNNVQDLIRGNLGIVIGLALSLFGLWMWLVQQATWGLLIVIAGAALTAFPGIYASLSQNIKGAFQDSLGDTVTEGDRVN